MEAPIPRGMKKPSQLNEYDGNVDLVDHIGRFEAMLHYHNVGDRIIAAEMPKQLGYALKQQLRLWLTR